jgi:hypothetical protein
LQCDLHSLYIFSLLNNRLDKFLSQLDLMAVD